MNVQVAVPPPWGQVEPQASTTELPRLTHTGEAPGEILRRQARDLLDEIPAAELPTALVFLQFLRERGAASLLGNDVKPEADEHDFDDTSTREDSDLPPAG